MNIRFAHDLVICRTMIMPKKHETHQYSPARCINNNTNDQNWNQTKDKNLKRQKWGKQFDLVNTTRTAFTKTNYWHHVVEICTRWGVTTVWWACKQHNGRHAWLLTWHSKEPRDEVSRQCGERASNTMGATPDYWRDTPRNLVVPPHSGEKPINKVREAGKVINTGHQAQWRLTS